MRKITFILFIVIVLEGCSSELASPRLHGITRSTAYITEPNLSTFTQEPSPIPVETGTSIGLGDPPAPTKVLPQRAPSTPTVEIPLDATYVVIGKLAEGQITIQKVPMVNQPDYSSCGEAAFAMAWNFLHPDLAQDIHVVEIIGVRLGVYFPALSINPQGYLGTSPAGMEAIGNYFAARYGAHAPTAENINLDNGGAYARLEAEGLLFRQLSVGNPIIIEVTDIIGNPSRSRNDSHYVIVTGMDFDAGIVTYNDPLVNISMSGKYTGFGRKADWSQVWNSWLNNRDTNPNLGGHPGRGWYMIVH
jgi:hypothetical protein